MNWWAMYGGFVATLAVLAGCEEVLRRVRIRAYRRECSRIVRQVGQSWAQRRAIIDELRKVPPE